MVVGCLAAAGGLSLVRARLADLQVVSVGVSLAPEASADEPQNILIIGTDNADRLASDDPVRHDRQEGSLLADVIMVLRIDPKSQTAALLSIPRDTYLPIEPTGRRSKINSAMGGPNGPQHLIDTIKVNFGISIEHYVEVDFRGFRDLVDVLDGVPVYLTHPVRDRNTQLLIEETGCITLDAVQALSYARSRHLEYFEDGKWRTDPTGDLGRISRQQDFIRRAGQRAIDRGLRNPNSALGLVNAATKAVTLDDTLTVGDIRDITNQYRSFNLDNLEKFQLPTVGAGSASLSYQNVQWAEAEPLLDRFRGIVEGADPEPRNVMVSVVGAEADAAEASGALEAAGFDADVDSTGKGGGQANVIRYGPKGAEAAALLGRYLAGETTFTADSSLVGRRLELTLGSSFDGILDEPRPASEIDTPRSTTVTQTTVLARNTTTTAPSSGDEGDGGGDTDEVDAPPETTTTTVIGVVPVDSAAAAACTG